MSENKKILIVDDEEDAIEFVEAALADVGEFTILKATDGESGLAKAKETVPDLIVLDVQMPGKGGFDVFNDLKKDPATETIKVIMLTGVAEKSGIRFSGEAMGAYFGKQPEAYIEKPVDPAQLQKTVAELLGE